MYLLDVNEIVLYRNGLKDRIFVDDQFSLLGIYSCMFKANAAISSVSVYVNNKEPSEVSAILIKHKLVSAGNVDKVFESLILHSNQSDSAGGHEYAFTIWIDENKVLDKSCVIENMPLFNKVSVDIFCNDLSFVQSIKQKYDQIKFFEGSHAYWAYLTKEFVPFKLPEGYTLKPITLADAKFALSHWKFNSRKGPWTMVLLSAAIGMAVGAYHNETGSLVSWIFSSWDGCLSALDTVKEHRGKGLAKAVTSELIKIYREKGLPVYVFTGEGLETPPVKSLFLDLGFTINRFKRTYWNGTTD